MLDDQEDDDVHNGPRRIGPTQIVTDGGLGSLTDQAFAKGRRLHSEGVARGGLPRPVRQDMREALLKGWVWQERRDSLRWRNKK